MSACLRHVNGFELYDFLQAQDLPGGRDVYRRLLSVARFDMTLKLVHYSGAVQVAALPILREPVAS